MYVWVMYILPYMLPELPRINTRLIDPHNTSSILAVIDEAVDKIVSRFHNSGKVLDWMFVTDGTISNIVHPVVSG